LQPLEQLVERCRGAGMRMTPQRRAIFRYLSGNSAHPTAEDIFRAVRRRHPGLSLATVYNTLETLHQLGEVGRLDVGGGAERFDPEVRPHHHFNCRRCGKVQDVFAELPVPHLGALPGCRVDSVQVQLIGLCQDCSRRSASKKPPERPRAPA
jgi:Fur family transcriptional regulator, peroxide stress response regulator